VTVIGGLGAGALNLSKLFNDETDTAGPETVDTFTCNFERFELWPDGFKLKTGLGLKLVTVAACREGIALVALKPDNVKSESDPGFDVMPGDDDGGLLPTLKKVTKIIKAVITVKNVFAGFWS